MLVSITPLGSRDADPGDAAIQVVKYVESKVHAARRLAPGRVADTSGYYADSVEGPGRWMGNGSPALGLRGEVAPEHLEHVLCGAHPGTGEQLRPMHPTPRARVRAVASACDANDVLSLEDAARLADVNVRYLRRIAARTEGELATRVGELLAGRPLSPTSRTLLFASRSGPNGGWMIERGELRRFLAARQPRKAVIGYDVTFSAPKSVSILWAVAGPDEQREIVAAVEAAVDAGLTYLESMTSTRSPSRPILRGLVVAAFLHGTSRNLDPQLHVHSIVANIAQRLDGEIRALDGRDLFAHAKTAGYLAAAHLRHECARRLGWRWGPVIHGLADVDGVPAEAIRAMSSRRNEIEAVISEMGVHSASGRQVAAYQTRAAKRAVEPNALRDEWDVRLADAGFDASARAACFARHVDLAPFSDHDRNGLLAQVGSARGVTERTAVFDRRDVIQVVASIANERLSAAQILDVTDEFLASEHTIPLAPAGRGDVIRLQDGRVAPIAGGLTRYSTAGMLQAERQVLDPFAAGLDRGLGIVPAELIDAAIDQQRRLGADQAAMVRAICSSGDQFQAVAGVAGAGKTAGLQVAVQAWQSAGYTVVGAADQGTAAEVLGAATAVRAETLEYWLTLLDTQPDPRAVFDLRTVLLVDEASTSGTRSLARLFAHAQRAGTVVRLVGDPAQHSAVTAGGAFRDLVDTYRGRTPHLTEMRRQAGPELAQLRLALRDYREGLITEAIERLRTDDRVVVAHTAGVLLDKLTADWWLDRQARRADPSRAPSSMVAEHHRERRALNIRARIMLAADGELHGPALEVASHEFRAGDEVICRAPAKHLHPPGQPGRYLRNGTRGTVLAVHPDGRSPGITVDFEHRGPIHVPIEFLTREVRPGTRGGVTYSYALTSHAAQGQTHDAARTLATDGSSRPGIYVGLTRGQRDSRLYAVRRRDLRRDTEAEDHLPRLDDDKTALESITDRLITSRPEQLATTHDPAATSVAELRDAHTLGELVRLYETAVDDTQRRRLTRAIGAQRDSLARRSWLQPPPNLLARIGPRPPNGADRRIWQAAITGDAVHHTVGDIDPRIARQLGLPDAASVADRMRNAEIAFLARHPTQDLAAEAAELANELTTADAGSLRHRQHLAAALSRADQVLSEARRAVSAAPAQVEHAPPTSTLAAAKARPTFERAQQDLARARWHREQLALRLALVNEEPTAHDKVARRLGCLHAAIDRQVHDAVEQNKTRAPDYIVGLLGPRPSDGNGRAWDERLHQLERYRHRHGRSPHDLVADASASPAERALGPCPTAPAAALAWRITLDAITAAPLAPAPAR